MYVRLVVGGGMTTGTETDNRKDKRRSSTTMAKGHPKTGIVADDHRSAAKTHFDGEALKKSSDAVVI